MFTGIVREVGRVVSARRRSSGGGLVLDLEAPATARGVRRGASVAVDGVCLTVVAAGRGRLRFDVGPETIRRSIVRAYRAGSRVNLERPLRAGDEIGGHFVQGHVDGVGRVLGLDRDGAFATLRLAAPATEPVVIKGSIALNGVSLTVASVEARRGGDVVEIMLIPETLDRTNLGALAPGAGVNVEFDVLGKYALRRLDGRAAPRRARSPGRRP